MKRALTKTLYLGLAASMVMAGLAAILTVCMQPNDEQSKLFDQLKADFSFSMDSGRAFVDVNDDESGYASVEVRDGDLSATIKATLRKINGLTAVAVPSTEPPPIAFSSFPTAMVHACGANTDGQLGIGTAVDTNTLQAVFVASDGGGPIGIGLNHTAVTDSEGVLWLAGNNSSGHFGDGSFTPSLTLVTNPLANAISVAAGNSHSLAVTEDGRIWSAMKP